LSAMNSRERVAAALRREEPDRVPYCELAVDRALAEKLMGWGEPDSERANLEANIFSVDEAKALAARLGADNICYLIKAPVYAQKTEGKDGRLFYGDGLIRTEADLDMLVLPDPHDDAMYAEAEEFVRQKGDYSLWFTTRMGVFNAWLSMGVETFSVALYENRPFVEEVFDRYYDWMEVVAERISQMDFDVFFTTDDMAFKSQPFFSPKVFEELVLPRHRRIAEKITIPWCMHSDGNLMPFLKDILDLGIDGLHPIEKGAMDIRAMKRDYGDRICLLGNVDLNLLGIGTPEQVDEEVRGLIRDVAPGGGYVVTSGNSLAAYLNPTNVLAMSEAVRKYGKYPISV
jgi:uroporphyrinogen decarboxylase